MAFLKYTCNSLLQSKTWVKLGKTEQKRTTLCRSDIVVSLSTVKTSYTNNSPAVSLQCHAALKTAMDLLLVCVFPPLTYAKTKRNISITNVAFQPLTLLLKLSFDSFHFAFHEMIFLYEALEILDIQLTRAKVFLILSFTQKSTS